MIFYKKIMKLAVLFAILMAGIIVKSGDNGESIQITENDKTKSIQIFTNKLKEKAKTYFASSKSQLKLNTLLTAIEPVLKTYFFDFFNVINGSTQLSVYFERVILNAARDDQNTFFTNPLVIAKLFEGEELSSNLDSPAKIKNHKGIFEMYSKPFILEVSKLEDDQFNLLLPIAANMAFFAFSDRSTLLRFIEEIKKINDINQQNKLMQILTESSIRTYCFEKNTHDEAWKKATIITKIRMKVMALWKNPISLDTMIYCLRQWNFLENQSKNKEKLSAITNYLGDLNSNLKDKLQKWLALKDEKVTDALANYIAIMGTEPSKTRALRLTRRTLAILGTAGILLSQVTKNQVEAKDALQSGTFYLVGAGLLYAMETSIGKLAIQKAKSYYESAKEKARTWYNTSAINQQYLKALRQKREAKNK